MVLAGSVSSNLLWLHTEVLLEPQEKSGLPSLCLEPWASLAPGPRPAASHVLIFSLQCPLKGSVL